MMTVRKGTPGRPVKGKPRQIRWTDEEWDGIARAADRMGMTRSEWVRRVVRWEIDRIGTGQGSAR